MADFDPPYEAIQNRAQVMQDMRAADLWPPKRNNSNREQTHRPTEPIYIRDTPLVRKRTVADILFIIYYI